MRVVHLTDLHIQRRPALRELLGKRLAATANLYLLGRRRKFDPVVQQAAVDAAIQAEPDVVVITGDLTAQATDAEFNAVADLLAPLRQRCPLVIIPGNHDTYVPSAVRRDRIGTLFGDALGPKHHLPYLIVHDEVAFLAIETCRAHLLSSGFTPPAHLRAARQLLTKLDSLSPRPYVFLIQHYPLLGRDGLPYGPPARALSNASTVLDFLAQTPGFDAVLHGHEHRGFQTQLPGPAGPIPVFNPGASGYAHLVDQDRTAHFNIYNVGSGGLRSIERKRWDGTAFIDEPGGPYATGR